MNHQAADFDAYASVGPEGLERLIARHHGDKLLLLLAGQSRVLEMLAEDVPLPRVLEELMHVIEQQVDGMLCSVLLCSSDGKRLRHGAAPSLPDDYNRAIDGAPIGPRVGSCGTAAYTGRPVVVSDIATDPLWADFKDLALAADLRACWSTPILSKRGDVLGTFAMYYREPMSPTPMHRDLIAVATHLARVAIERDNLVSRLKRSLQERDESLSVLAVGSHELRTPLSVLRLDMDALLSMLHESTPDPETEQLVMRSLRQLDRLGHLIIDLLDVSRLTTGHMALHAEEGDLAEIVLDTTERVRHEFEQRQCQLSVRADGPVRGGWDRMRIDQVVTNLLGNALKYGEGRPVEVLVDGDEEHGRVLVHDAGIGISREQQEAIFEQYTRAVEERSYQGVGLGLWITRQIVDALGGTIRVESEPGKGSTFVIALPRAGGSVARRTS